MAKKKTNFSNIAKNTLITAATGAAAHVVAEAIDLKPENKQYIDYGMIAAGVILPEVVKGGAVELAGNALLAVGAYRTAERHKLASKLGFNTISGVDNTVIGNSGWTPARTVYTENKNEKKNTVK